MARLAASPVCSARTTIKGSKAFLNKLLSGLMDTLIISRKHPGIKSCRRGPFVFLYPRTPRIRNRRILLVNRQKVDTGSRVGNIIVLCVNSEESGTVLVPLKISDNFVPRCTAYVFKDHQRRPMLIHPRHHASECSTRLALGVDILLLVVESGVVDA